MIIKQRIGICLLLAFVLTMSVQAQRVAFFRINEVLVINEDNLVDDYGKRHSWIEIYNSSPATIDIGGCFLTNDLNNTRLYPIPKGDIHTKVKPYQHVLFWADNNPYHGTFHLNFTLDSIKPNFIALYDADGRTLIDSITVPAGQKADISYGLVEDGWTQARLNEELRLNPLYKRGSNLWVHYDKVTPNANNVVLDTNERIENFKENDEMGWGMSATAMTVVFLGLILLYLFFKLVGNIAVWLSRKRAMKASGLSKEQAKLVSGESGAVFAAIAMAIHEISESEHDDENTVLTIKNVARNYSPWSSKIYSLRELPKKK